MIKMSTEKWKYLDEGKELLDDIKNIVHHFYQAFIEANNTNILEVESPILICRKQKRVQSEILQ